MRYYAIPAAAYLLSSLLLAHYAPLVDAALARQLCTSQSCRCPTRGNVYCHSAFSRADARHFTGLSHVYARFAGATLEFSAPALASVGNTINCTAIASPLTTIVMPDCGVRVLLVDCLGFNLECHKLRPSLVSIVRVCICVYVFLCVCDCLLPYLSSRF